MSCSHPIAAFATTNATVALSVSSFARVNDMQNFPAISHLLSLDQIMRVTGPFEGMTGKSAPCGNVFYRAGVAGNQMNGLSRLENSDATS